MRQRHNEGQSAGKLHTGRLGEGRLAVLVEDAHLEDEVGLLLVPGQLEADGQEVDAQRLADDADGRHRHHARVVGQHQADDAGDEPVVVQITGFGPSSTEYVDPTQDPRKRGKAN